MLKRIPTCGALLLALVTVPVAAQQPELGPSSCGVIHGLGPVSPVDCLYPGAGNLELITLDGSFEVLTNGQAQQTRVSCWVCEGPTCNSDSPYGPSWVRYLMAGSTDQAWTADWTLKFFLSAEALGSSVGLPTLDSYYCRIETSADARPVTDVSFGVPDYFSTDLATRALEGTPLVTELQGVFAEPVVTKPPRGG